MVIVPIRTRRGDKHTQKMTRIGATAFTMGAAAILVAVQAAVPSRDRIVKQRKKAGLYSRHRDNGLPIDGNNYRTSAGRQKLKLDDTVYEEREQIAKRRASGSYKKERNSSSSDLSRSAASQDALALSEYGEEFMSEDEALRAFPFGRTGTSSTSRSSDFNDTNGDAFGLALPDFEEEQGRRSLGSQLTGCCYNYKYYNASDLCTLYGQDCESGETPSHDDEGGDCSLEGLSFIGVSFSVNSAYGNQYSYSLNDQFPIDKLIDRDYKYIMSMDEDGWLVGGGYKQFDYSGKMPYIDSGHTEILRVGSMDVNRGYVLLR
jgi:hypothetical protein